MDLNGQSLLDISSGCRALLDILEASDAEYREIHRRFERDTSKAREAFEEAMRNV